MEVVMNALSKLCFVCGFLSIAGSIAVWYLGKSGDNFFWQNGDPAHAERFGIFVGLWAPTFFILSDRFEKMANRKDSQGLESKPRSI
jgi:hypothetical protein